MTSELILDFIRSAMTVTLLVAGPMLVTALVVGVLISMLQAVTQIQEQTLTFVPKLVAIAGVLFALLPWLMRQVVGLLVHTLQSIPTIIS